MNNNLPIKIQSELEVVNSITDKLGKGVDEGIKLLIAVLRVHGFATTSSCYGHEDHGSPFVDISSKIAEEFIASETYKNLLDEIESDPGSSENIRKYTIATKDAKIANEQEGLRLLNLVEGYQEQNETSGIIISRYGGLHTHKLQTQKGMFLDIMLLEEKLKVLNILQQEFNSFTTYLIHKLG